VQVSILYDPGVYKEKIKLSYDNGKGLAVHTEKPMQFDDAVKVDYVSHDRFLYEKTFDDTEIISGTIKELLNINFASIINSLEEFQIKRYSEVVLSYRDFFFSFELTLRNPERSENTETQRVHRILLKLFDHIGMSNSYDYDTQRVTK